MRTVLTVVLAVSGCSQRSVPEEAETGAFEPADTVHRTADAVKIDVHRRDVPLEAMPILASVLAGLPMQGMANVAIELSAPIVDHRDRYGKASGSIAVACPTGCTLGDDRAKLAFGGLGDVAFGHLTFDSIDIRAEIHDGLAEITKWEVVSKDLDLHARMRIDLDDALDASTLDGCLWFKDKPSLARRDPKAAALIQTTGATPNRDGFYSIRITGTIGKQKRLAQECGAI